jgi:hypothetical protein
MIDAFLTEVETATTPNALAIVLSATIGIPFLVLVVDYVFRTESGFVETMRGSGPDLCLLGLGAVGSVFLDSKVASAFFIPPALGGTVVVLIIFGLRGVCFRLQKLPLTTGVAFATMVMGIASVLVVGAVLVFSYLA